MIPQSTGRRMNVAESRYLEHIKACRVCSRQAPHGSCPRGISTFDVFNRARWEAVRGVAALTSGERLILDGYASTQGRESR